MSRNARRPLPPDSLAPRRGPTRSAFVSLALLASAPAPLFAGVAPMPQEAPAVAPDAPAGVVRIPVPGTAVELELIDVREGKGEKPLLMMRREVTWNLFDVFVFQLDKRKGNSTAESDAMTRPTKPYISVDRGFGHNGHPAISMSFENALRFADWVSVKTGHRFRIPTVEEWSELCAAAAPDPSVTAWHAANAGARTHKVAERSADRLGCFDVLGNVGEWVVATAPDGTRRGVVLGGSFRDPLDDLGCERVQESTPDWNISDPQFPKSIWWLADADFVGMRLVCDGPITGASNGANAATEDHAGPATDQKESGR